MDVSLVLTHDCNLGCTYCFAGEKFRKVMSPEVMRRGLDLAFSDDAENVQLSFFGGEPTTRYSFTTTKSEPLAEEGDPTA